MARHGSCHSCNHYKPLGDKWFCYKHDKVVKSIPSYCKDFKTKTEMDTKKRVVIFEKEEGETANIHGPIEGTGEVDIESSKKRSTDSETMFKKRAHIDIPVGSKTISQGEAVVYDKSQKLFFVILGLGIVIIIFALIATGVF